MKVKINWEIYKPKGTATFDVQEDLGISPEEWKNMDEHDQLMELEEIILDLDHPSLHITNHITYDS